MFAPTAVAFTVAVQALISVSAPRHLDSLIENAEWLDKDRFDNLVQKGLETNLHIVLALRPKCRFEPDFHDTIPDSVFWDSQDVYKPWR